MGSSGSVLPSTGGPFGKGLIKKSSWVALKQFVGVTD